MNRKLLFIYTLVAFALLGCASQLDRWQWTVIRFHNLGSIENLRSKTFVILPLRRENNDSLEFQSYASLVATKLQAYGMLLSPKTEMGKTDFTVVLDYGIGEPYQVNYSYPIFGQIAGGSTNYSGTVYSGGRAANYSGTATTVPQYGVVGAGSGSITNYVQYVHIFILEGKLNQEGQVVRRYEGKAQGAGYLTDLTKIAPSGLKALFLEFPGPSGVSKTETFFGVDQIP